MTTATISSASSDSVRTTLSQSNLIQYYEDAGPDYEAWSKNFNMHFGYGSFLDILNREKMLEQMNEMVLRRLNIADPSTKRILDMGCGLGATLRHGAASYPEKIFTGVTIVPWQIQKGKELNRIAGLSERIVVLKADYTQLPFPDNSFDSVYALESACHAYGPDKEIFLKEMYRVLKPGGKFVIADGFVKTEREKLNKLVSYCYQSICENWAMTEMAHIDKFSKCLAGMKFENVKVEDISWKVGPSALHAPFVILSFVLKKLLKGEKLKEYSSKNLKGSIMALLLGLVRSNFGYYIVSGSKK